MYRKLFSLMLMLVLLAACSSGTESVDPAGPVTLEGPALVMFYTDN